MSHPALSSNAFRDLAFYKAVDEAYSDKIKYDALCKFYNHAIRNIRSAFDITGILTGDIKKDHRTALEQAQDMHVELLIERAISEAKLQNTRNLYHDGKGNLLPVGADHDGEIIPLNPVVGDYVFDTNGNVKEVIGVGHNSLAFDGKGNLKQVSLTIDPDDPDPASTVRFVQAKIIEHNSLWQRVKRFFRHLVS